MRDLSRLDPAALGKNTALQVAPAPRDAVEELHDLLVSTLVHRAQSTIGEGWFQELVKAGRAMRVSPAPASTEGEASARSSGAGRSGLASG